jgi:hypothetical protein
MSDHGRNGDAWTRAWTERYPAPRRPGRRRIAGWSSGRYALASSLVLALLVAPFAIAHSRSDGTLRVRASDDRYAFLARNTLQGDGGAGAFVCSSNRGANREPCLNMTNKGDGFAAAFRTRGLTGFRLQTSGQGTAVPFDLDSNATGKVDFLNADMVDGQDSSEIGRELWARVTGGATPTLQRDNGADAVSRQGVGDYRVTFDRDVNNCSYQVTPSDVTDSLTAAADADASNNRQVVVSLRSSEDGNRADGAFQVTVNC